MGKGHERMIEMLRGLGPARLIILAMVTIVLVGFFVFLTSRVSTGEMELLYGDLGAQDVQEITARLGGMGIDYEVTADRTGILVPSSSVGEARMALAQEGLPSGGSVGYELFDEDQGFATTSFVQQINQARALEGELARTIATLAQVRQARVHLVLPKRELFSREQTPASASVFLSLRGGAQLGREQVAAIRSIVSAAVPNMEPDQVAIVDERGRLLARRSSDEGEGFITESAEERTRQYEARLQAAVEEIVARVVGYGRVRANITADLDFDRIATSEERFNPDEQVVRSTQLIEEEMDATDQEGRRNVTVANNLPGEEADDSEDVRESRESSLRTEEMVNYEISRTVRDHVRESGQVRRLSVAVLVDGIYDTVEDGETTYSPRPEAEMEQIASLVRTTVGYDPSRGDQLEIVNLRFVEEQLIGEEGTSADMLFGFPKREILKIVETGVVGLVAILVLLLVVRPLLSRMMSEAQAQGEGGHEGQLLLSGPSGGGQALAMAGAGGGSMQPMIQGAGGGMVPADGPTMRGRGADELEEVEEERMIDISQVEGRVKQSSIKKVGEIVEKHPSEAVSILRSWLYQEG